MSDAPIRRTWEEREYVLLEAIARAEDQENGEPLHSLDSRLQDATGLPDRDVQLGLRALYEAGYIAGNAPGVNQRVFDLIGIRLLQKGRRRPSADSRKQVTRTP